MAEQIALIISLLSFMIQIKDFIEKKKKDKPNK